MIFLGSKKDLEIAEKAIEIMKVTTNFPEFQENWENYLFRIERAWELTERKLRNKKGFQQWHDPYTKLRKKDSLLVFLKQARNSEMHSVSPTVSKPLKMLVHEKTGRGFQLGSISSKLENGTLTINLDSPDILLDMGAKLIPTNPEVIRFKNRGKWYNPPWEHLKIRIEDVHPVTLAMLGLDFYKTYINEAEGWLTETQHAI